MVDAATGQKLRSIQSERRPESLQFLNENELLVNGLNLVVVFKDEIPAQVFQPQTSAVNIAVSDDKNKVACAYQKGIIDISEFNSFFEEFEHERGNDVTCAGHYLIVDQLDFHPHRPFLLSTGWDAKTRIWDTNSGVEVVSTSDRAVQFDSSGKTIGFVNRKMEYGRLVFDDSETCMQLRAYEKAHGSVVSLAFSADTKYLVSVSQQPNELLVWEVDSGQLIARYKNREFIRSVVFNPNNSNQFLVTKTPGTQDGPPGGIELCEIIEKQLAGLSQFQVEKVRTIKEQGYFHETAFTSKGDQIIVGVDGDEESNLDGLETWSWPDLKLVNAADRHSWMEFVSISPDGKLAALSSHAWNAVTVVKMQAGEEVLRKILQVHEGGLEAGAKTAFSSNGKWFSCSSSSGVEIYDTESWNLLVTIPRTDPGVGDIAFSGDNQYLAIANLNFVGLHKTGEFQQIAKIQTAIPQQVSGMTLSENPTLTFDRSSRFLAVGTSENSVQLWDLKLLRKKLGVFDLDWGDKSDR